MQNNDTSPPTPGASAAPAPNGTPTDLETLLGEDHAPPWWKRASFWIGLAVVLAMAGIWYAWNEQKKASAAPV